jgi:hypothetical protein
MPSCKASGDDCYMHWDLTNILLSPSHPFHSQNATFDHQEKWKDKFQKPTHFKNFNACFMPGAIV